jgi:hypothetical protein
MSITTEQFEIKAYLKKQPKEQEEEITETL